jgi:regulator of protease activity HflC (stomatin/prohibitin superfamily)
VTENARTEAMEDSIVLWFWLVRLGLASLAGIVAAMAGCPQYEVYKKRLEGEAQHQFAEGARRALISQALAEKEAAISRAEAVKVMGQAAKDYPEYRRQEFIGAFAHALQEGKINQIIYVPTEAGIPVTEAQRLAKP